MMNVYIYSMLINLQTMGSRKERERFRAEKEETVKKPNQFTKQIFIFKMFLPSGGE